MCISSTAFFSLSSMSRAPVDTITHLAHSPGPILEPAEFRQRYIQFARGNSDALPVPGQLVAMSLVVWAASFGVNEYGVEDQEPSASIRGRKEHVNEMLQEILYLIDLHGILRKASWDGVRLLLLMLPLTQGRIAFPHPLQCLTTYCRNPVSHGSLGETLLTYSAHIFRQPDPTPKCKVMYEATLSQIYNLCSLGPSAPIPSGQSGYIDALVRARIFWYGHVVDGVTSALRGGRILL